MEKDGLMLIKSLKKRSKKIGVSLAKPYKSKMKMVRKGASSLASFKKKAGRVRKDRLLLPLTGPAAIKKGLNNAPSIMRGAAQGKGFLYPGSKYIGPGNKLDSGKPTSQADAVAREHDYQYDYLLKKGKNPYWTFNEADRHAIRRVKTHTPAGAAVFMGLSAKRLLPSDRTPVPLIPDYGHNPPYKPPRPKKYSKIDDMDQYPKRRPKKL